MTALPPMPRFRVARVTTVAILVAALSAACNALVEPPPAGSDQAMKTDPALVSRDAKAAERRRARIQGWVEQSLAGSYAAVGQRNPKWDARVERAFRLAARHFTSDATAPADLADHVSSETSQALAAGCTDPLVAYVRYRFSDDTPVHELKDTVERLEASAYPAHWKGWAALAYEQKLRPCCALVEPDPGKDFRAAQVARARAHLPEIAADRTMPTRRVIQYANRLLQAYMWLDEQYEAHYQDVRAVIVAARGAQDPSLPPLEAWFHVRLANAARGSKWANQTSREQLEAHGREMRVADDLTARLIANGADPVDVAELASAIAWGLGERAALEEWFTIGTRLEPGNYTWYDDKVTWLQERWFGSDEELLAFGRQMLAQARYEARVSMVLLDAHHRVQLGPPKKAGYFARPDVCRDYVAVYDGLLSRYPDAWYDRNRYLRRLIECQDWDGAARQLAALGPSRVTAGQLRGKAAYDATSKVIRTRAAS